MNYIFTHMGQMVELTGQHLRTTLIAVGLAVALGVPLGILITRWRWLYSPVLAVTGVLYTIPSLALFAFLLPMLGLGVRPTIAALVLYSQLAIVRNTAVGINNVDRAIIEAATGMGMTRWQILRLVQLPLALAVMMVGVRLAVVMSIGTASIMSLAGAGGLGSEIFAGIDRVQDKMILAGALPAALLAIAADLGMGALERWLTPRGLRQA